MDSTPASAWCLSLLLSKPSAVQQVMQLLRVQHFVNKTHREIYNALIDAYDAETDRFPAYRMETRLGAAAMNEMALIKRNLEPPLHVDLKSIASSVVEEWRLDILNRVALLIIEKSQALERSDDIVKHVKVLLSELEVGLQKPFKHISETIDDTIRAIIARTETNTLTSSGCEILDYLLGGGFNLGEFVVLASLTNMGKSFFAAQIALALARAGVPIAIMGLEMDDTEYNERMIVRIARQLGLDEGLRLSNLKNPMAFGLDEDNTIMIAKQLALLGIFYLQPKTVSVDDLKNYCEIAVNQHKVGAIFLDHMLLLDTDDAQHEMVEEVSKYMKNFATEKKIISFSVCQMTRDADIYSPQVKNMAGGRAIEHQATTLLTIGKYREEQEPGFNVQPAANANAVDNMIRKITLLKSRSSRAGTWYKSRFIGDNATFEAIKPHNWQQIKNDGKPNVNFTY